VLVEARELSVRYAQRVAVDRVSFTLGPGCTALLGPNGAGKTSVLKVLTGSLRPAGGTLWVDGTVVDSRVAVRALRGRLGHVAQETHLPPNFTVSEVLAYAAWLKLVSPGVSEAQQRQALSDVGLLERSADRVSSLSGGMKQRLAIAMAVVNRPGLLLLDEPTVGLDPQQRSEFRASVSQLAGITTVLATHLVDDVAKLSDRVIVMGEGRVRFNGTTTDLCGVASADEVTADRVEAAYLALLPG
jgi:ABC-2 type transport system ATP-binding protein